MHFQNAYMYSTHTTVCQIKNFLSPLVLNNLQKLNSIDLCWKRRKSFFVQHHLLADKKCEGARAHQCVHTHTRTQSRTVWTAHHYSPDQLVCHEHHLLDLLLLNIIEKEEIKIDFSTDLTIITLLDFD